MWQKIETAPKDGTVILAFAHPIAVLPAICWWAEAPEEAGIYCPKWQWQTRDAEDFARDSDWIEHWSEVLYEPTHWMPLPANPGEKVH